MPQNTTILISKESRDKLKEVGKKGETYTEIINRMYKELKLKESTDMLMDIGGYMSIEQARQWTRERNKLEK